MVLTNGDLVPPNPRPTLLTLFALFLTFKAGGFQMWSCERPKEGIQIRKRERRQLRERQVGGMRRENGGGDCGVAPLRSCLSLAGMSQNKVTDI